LAEQQQHQQQTAAALVNELEKFLRAFKDREGNYKYFDRINHLMASNSISLVVDYIDFDSYNPELAKQITHNPDEMFDAFNEAVFYILNEIHPDYAHEIRTSRLEWEITLYKRACVRLMPR